MKVAELLTTSAQPSERIRDDELDFFRAHASGKCSRRKSGSLSRLHDSSGSAHSRDESLGRRQLGRCAASESRRSFSSPTGVSGGGAGGSEASRIATEKS